MNKGSANAGMELLFLLRQQRYLYHRLKTLTIRQYQLLGGASSPDLLLEVIFGRCRLIEKLRQLDGRLRRIKTNWKKLSRRIEPEYKTRAYQTANQVQEIFRQILAVGHSKTDQDLLLKQDWAFEGFVVDSRHRQ